MRIGFAGTPAFASVILDDICKKYLNSKDVEVAVVLSQPDRPQGRGRKLQPTEVKKIALSYGIEVLQPLKLKGFEETLKNYKLDLLIVAAYGLIVPQKILDLPKLGCINIHGSLLPRWRGAAPIQHAILANDKTTGISIMQMEAGLDTGPYCMQESIDIKNNDNYKTLHDKLVNIGSKLICQFIDKLIVNSKIEWQKQNEELVTYAHKIDKNDGLIKWSEPTQISMQKIKAYYGWPVAFTKCAGKTVKIWEAIPQSNKTDDVAGKVIRISKHGIDVKTIDGSILITRVQFEGGKPLSASEFFNNKHHWLQEGMTFDE